MNPRPKLTDAQIKEAAEAYVSYGGVTSAARGLGLSARTMSYRLELAELRGLMPAAMKVKPTSPSAKAIISDDKARISCQIDDGVVLVGSDAHYWPGIISTAHRGLVWACKALKPRIVVMNGDICDFPMASRHARIGWEKRPTIKEEIEVVSERLNEISDALPGGTIRAWPLGNHDARFETRIANELPQFESVGGFQLKDHFPEWTPCWGVWINDDVVIKHRWKGGIHATYNNTLQSGVTLVTGHLHSMNVRPYTDYRGTRYGVDTGTLAEPSGPQFTEYTEDNPKNWRSGFVVLTFRGGNLLLPELAQVWSDDEIEFRGEVIKV